MSDLRFQEVLLARRHQETFRVQRADQVVPDGTALSVVAAHPSGHVALNHLQDERAKTELGGFPGDRTGLGPERANLGRFPVRDDAVHLHLQPELQVLRRRRKGLKKPHQDRTQGRV